MSANCTPAQLKALTDFGYHVGLAFRVIDDILDVTQSTETLGKTAGKDVAAQRPPIPDWWVSTSPARSPRDSPRRHLGLSSRSRAALSPWRALAKYLLERDR